MKRAPLIASVGLCLLLAGAQPGLGEFQVNTYTTNSQVGVAVAGNANGDFVVKRIACVSPVRKERRMRISRSYTMIALVLAMLVASGAYGNVRLGDGGEVPFYARLTGAILPALPAEIYHDADVAAVPFYRPPTCIPADFNLLDFFDPAAFDCGPPATDGFTVWQNGPDVDVAPIQSNLKGTGAVPVWIVSWPELQSAIADNVLTIGELAALPSLIQGVATFYQEVLHPTGGAQVGKVHFAARGVLEDGRSFQLWGSEIDQVNDGNASLRIIFK